MSTIAAPSAKATTCDLTAPLSQLLSREWLLTDGLGGFAAGSVIGCPTRRYHGLLIASKRPPLQRYLLLAGTLDRVLVGHQCFDLSTYEFNGTFHPQGYRLQTGFAIDTAQPTPWVEFTFANERFEARKRITLCSGIWAVRLSYEVRSLAGDHVALEVSPLVALRDFHGFRRIEETDPWHFHSEEDSAWFHSREDDEVTLAVLPTGGQAHWEPKPLWWRAFRYRTEFNRGFDGQEDLFNAGSFRTEATGSLVCELTAVGFADCLPTARTIAARKAKPRPACSTVCASRRDDAVAGRLALAADQFVVHRTSARGTPGSTTILAGYPWFGDWGRDSFISLEGLLLIPGRYEEAREVLATFAGAQRNGLIPNRFDDYGGECAYNSVDASLWFIHAADAYLRYSKDARSWDAFLYEACRNVIRGFCGGTDYGICVEDRGLVSCGNEATQITWMDAKCDGTAFTPRNGRPVEVNALWYHALHVVAERTSDRDRQLADHCRDLITRLDRSFCQTFWNKSVGCLYDCVRDGEADEAIRPNQIFAVSLPHSPLPERERKAVFGAVSEHLLTPYGLRTLSPDHLRYVSRYSGGWYERDRAYHNGTVWSWLMGPFVEAHLRVHDFTPRAKSYARRLLEPLTEHLDEAGLGSVSEIFDADKPHTPRGCPAQAWGVAEFLRAWHLTTPD
jgi:predicted glycogen debranching enzyme